MESLDAIVIGANMRGLITASILSDRGCRAVVLDRAPRIGGADGSFVTPGGALFDHGLHVLDHMRSEVTTRLFTEVVNGAVHRVLLRRGIVLRNHVLPYAPRPVEMPPELREMLPGDELVDDLGDALPTRERLAECYGRAFADLIYEEVLPSYRCEARHRRFGVPEAYLLDNIYPWLFPRALRTAVSGDESRAFHDKLRAGVAQEILYPRVGGFGGFAGGFRRRLDADRVEVLLGVEDLHVEVQERSHIVRWVGARGRRFRAPHVFWAAAWPRLCALLALPCQDPATDRVLLGSFRLNRPARSDYEEILVGDPRYQINRISFPARFRESHDPLIQVEYAVPEAEVEPLGADAWRDIWLDDLRGLRLIDNGHRLEESDFKSFRMHYNAYGMEGERLRDPDSALLHPDSNIRPVVPSMANLNLNRYVPRVVTFLRSVLDDTSERQNAAPRVPDGS